ncbi:hypothetical protein MKW92_042801 [Papaver armeniacum]|nr:hypothetical protein MKW92_039816 [Papaver armeniacum]KAI3946412.1 hypothetical protein MKW92_042801 [Papaver armeniacum]
MMVYPWEVGGGRITLVLEHDDISSLNNVPDRLLVLGRLWWDETIPTAVTDSFNQSNTTTCL